MLPGESPEEYFIRTANLRQERRQAQADTPDAMDILDVMEAMGAHFKEKHHAIKAWSWKLFCRKWCRLIKWAWEEEQRQQQRDAEHEITRLEQEHKQRLGM